MDAESTKMGPMDFPWTEESAAVYAERRRAEILAATFEVLIESGYEKVNTLAIARRARTSKETLYNLFGSKQALLDALVAWTLDQMQAEIESSLVDDGSDVRTHFQRLANCLLTVWGKEENIAIVRAVTAQIHDVPAFGRLVTHRSLEFVSGRFNELLAAAADQGLLSFDDRTEAYEVFIGILTGGYYFRRIVGEQLPLGAPEVERRAARTVELFFTIYAPKASVP